MDDVIRRAQAFVHEQRNLQTMDRSAVYEQARDYEFLLRRMSSVLGPDPTIDGLLSQLREIGRNTLVFAPGSGDRLLSRNPRVFVR